MVIYHNKLCFVFQIFCLWIRKSFSSLGNNKEYLESDMHCNANCRKWFTINASHNITLTRLAETRNYRFQ